MTATALKLKLIVRDGGTQPRAGLVEETVAEYQEARMAGATFPPVVVFHDGKRHWLADGFHRCEAWERDGIEEIDADVRQGGQRDAILYSVGANADHGLPRTNADKRRAVLRLLADPEWAKWSDREIAKACRVSHEMVRQQRQLSTVDSSPRIGADGKERRLPQRAPEPEPSPPPPQGYKPLLAGSEGAALGGKVLRSPDPQPEPAKPPTKIEIVQPVGKAAERLHAILNERLPFDETEARAGWERSIGVSIRNAIRNTPNDGREALAAYLRALAQEALS